MKKPLTPIKAVKRAINNRKLDLQYSLRNWRGSHVNSNWSNAPKELQPKYDPYYQGLMAAYNHLLKIL